MLAGVDTSRRAVARPSEGVDTGPKGSVDVGQPAMDTVRRKAVRVTLISPGPP